MANITILAIIYIYQTVDGSFKFCAIQFAAAFFNAPLSIQALADARLARCRSGVFCNSKKPKISSKTKLSKLAEIGGDQGRAAVQ